MSTFATKDDLSAVPPSKPATNLIRNSLLAMAILSFLFSTAFATVGILVLKRIDSLLTDLQHLAIYGHILVYIVYAEVCLFGIYSVSFRKTKQISFYMALVVGQILFSLTIGILCLYLFYNPTASRAWNTAQCSTPDSFTVNLCRNTALMKGIATALFAVMWLVEFATIFFGNAYLNQLYEEDMRIEMLDPKYYDDDARNC